MCEPRLHSFLLRLFFSFPQLPSPKQVTPEPSGRIKQARRGRMDGGLEEQTQQRRLWRQEVRRIKESSTFDSRQVDAGVLVDPDAVADDPQGAFLERARARNQLQ